MRINLAKFKKFNFRRITFFILLPSFLVVLIISYLVFYNFQTQNALQASNISIKTLNKDLEQTKIDYENLKKTDQVKRNDELEKTIQSIEQTYKQAIETYEELIDLPSSSKELPNFRKQFANVLKYLSEKNYASGASELATLKTSVEKEKEALLASYGGINVASLTNTTTPPGSGYQRQAVSTLDSTYIVDIVAGDLSSTKVFVDTASETDCRDNCPTLPLATYVSRNGAYAGINGSYFCPADYPSCAGKSNSFDTLAMGKNKHYHNSDNNVYSTVPLVAFGNGWIRFVGASSGWGRDTGVDGVLANQPLLLSGGNVTFGGDGDPKKGSRGNRSFVANKGNTVYIGVVRNATVAEAAHVLQAMGMEGALNLDSGGSTALWASGGYKAGPGRNIPNAILFANK